MSNPIDNIEEKLNRALSYLCTSNQDSELIAGLINTAIEMEFHEELLDYIHSHPDISLISLWEAATMYWLPPIIVTDEPVNDDTLYETRDRLLKKLSRFISCEEDLIRVYNEIVYPSMQLLFIDEMETYIDAHPSASYDEINSYCNGASKRINNEICSQFHEEDLLADDSAMA